MSIFSNTTWNIVGNGFPGVLNINDNPNATPPLSGDIYGDKLVDGSIVITGNAISFTRQGNGFQQMWSGTAVSVGGGVDSIWSIMGMFTHRQGGQQSGPFLWGGSSELIPG
jgi:hypothetical protein